jgi:hypothetical protein
LAVELSGPDLVAVQLDDDDLPYQVEVGPQVDGEASEHLSVVVVEQEEETGLPGFLQFGDGWLVHVHVLFLVLLVFLSLVRFGQRDDGVAEVHSDVLLSSFHHVLCQQLFDFLWVEFGDGCKSLDVCLFRQLDL